MSQKLTGKVIELRAQRIEVEISDDAQAERYTFGELWFDVQHRLMLEEMSQEILTIDQHKPLTTYRIYVLNHYYDFQGLGVTKPVMDEGLLKVGFSTEDLIGVGDYEPKTKNIKA